MALIHGRRRHLLRVFWQQHISNRNIREFPKNQPHHLSYDKAASSGLDISAAVRRVYDFSSIIHGWKIPRGRPKTRSANSIKRDLNYAGLDTTNVAQSKLFLERCHINIPKYYCPIVFCCWYGHIRVHTAVCNILFSCH